MCSLLTHRQSCQVELVEFLESLISVISRSRRVSVGGGVADIFRWGGGSRNFYFSVVSPKADAIQWEGVVAEFFRDPQMQTRFSGGGG